MPEGPEVKIIQTQLSEHFQNQNLEDVSILSGRYSKNKKPVKFDEFKENLPLKCINVSCKGKFLYFEFENGWFMWNTLGMTGGWTQQQKNHLRAQFKFNNQNWFFNDIRNFGTITFSNKIELMEKLNSIGPDIMTSVGFENFKEFLLCTKNKNKTIVEFLMNQKNISGVGNYIKSESLYKSKLSPYRTCSSLNDNEIQKLLISIKEIMFSSLKANGATFKNYTNTEDKKGEFAFQFEIYGKTVDKHGNAIIAETTKDKRTTFWVPEIQN